MKVLVRFLLNLPKKEPTVFYSKQDRHSVKLGPDHFRRLNCTLRILKSWLSGCEFDKLNRMFQARVIRPNIIVSVGKIDFYFQKCLNLQVVSLQLIKKPTSTFPKLQGIKKTEKSILFSLKKQKRHQHGLVFDVVFSKKSNH